MIKFSLPVSVHIKMRHESISISSSSHFVICYPSCLITQPWIALHRIDSVKFTALFMLISSVFFHYVCTSVIMTPWADNCTCVLWQCAPEMLGWAEAEEAEGHQEDQHIHRHVCGVLQPLCYYEVSRDLGVKYLRASWKYIYKPFYYANSSNVTKTPLLYK